MSTLRPVWTEPDLGSAAWQLLHELARLRGRRPVEQARMLVRYALWRALAGDDVELSYSALESLDEEAVA